MYERFTDRARKVMQLANQEAQKHCHEYIGTEHVILGLVRESINSAPNAATAILSALGVDIHKIPGEVEKLIQSGPDMVTIGKLPQTPRAKKVIEYALQFANSRNECVELEHILMGLMNEREGVAAQVLANLGATYEKALGIIPAGAPKKQPVRESTEWTYVFGVDLASGGGVRFDGAPVSLPEPPKPACETCRYFVTKPLRPGSCRRYPPTPFGYTEELGGKNICDFPTVLAEDWCGEYEAKAEVK